MWSTKVKKQKKVEEMMKTKMLNLRGQIPNNRLLRNRAIEKHFQELKEDMRLQIKRFLIEFKAEIKQSKIHTHKIT